jgi:hypothetical protein
MAGLALLRAAPFLAATSSVTFTLSEDIFIRPLAKTPTTELRRHANRLLPSQGRWLWPGLGIVFGTYGLSIATAIANLARGDPAVHFHSANSNSRLAAGFYLAGCIFSFLHFPWGVKAMALLKSIRTDSNVDGDEKRDNTAAMRAWLKVNWLRGLLADLPSWVCYFVAYMYAMS